MLPGLTGRALLATSSEELAAQHSDTTTTVTDSTGDGKAREQIIFNRSNQPAQTLLYTPPHCRPGLPWAPLCSPSRAVVVFITLGR